MTAPRVLVAGVGNVFLGDDAFGCEVARRLSACSLPDGVHVVDFGVRGIDIGFALLSGCEAAIVIDATSRGEPPGTLYVIEPPLDAASHDRVDDALAAHGVSPASALELVRVMGGRVAFLRVLGCEPSTFGADGVGCVGLSDCVAAVIDDAVELALSLIAEARTMLGGVAWRSSHA